MRRDFGTIRKSSAGKWYGRYKYGGNEFYTPSRQTKSAVKADLLEIQAKIMKGETEHLERPQARGENITVRMFWNVWYSALEAAEYSPNTIRGYRSSWSAHIIPLFGERNIASITGDDFDALRQALIDKGRNSKTILNVQLAFSAGLAAAKKAGYIDKNPVRITKPRRGAQPVMRRSQSLTSRQLDDLIDACDDYWKAALVLGGWGALRYGELAALTREDISIDGGLVTINKAVKRAPGGALVIGPPKSDAAYRTVSLPQRVTDIIVHHLDEYVAPEANALLYETSTGKYMPDKHFREALHAACEALNLPKLRFHDLRHTGLTAYGQAGATLADLMRRAGHTDPKTVMIYQHSDQQRDTELANRMT